MGLFDRFNKKRKDDQLEQAANKGSASLVASKPAPAAPSTSVVSVGSKSGAYRIIIRPLVTEKAAVMQSGRHYAFIVASGANKIQIREAVKDLYGVEPVGVNVLHVAGKRVRFGRSVGHRSDYKKAIVTLPPGASITIHEGV